MFDVTVKQCQLGAEPHSEACCPIRRSHKLQTADKQSTNLREKQETQKKAPLTEKQQRNIQHSSVLFVCQRKAQKRVQISVSGGVRVPLLSETFTCSLVLKQQISSGSFSLSLLCGLTEPPSPAGFCVDSNV